MSTASHLTCHCGLINEPATLLADTSLPGESMICHCNTCRRHTGALATWYLGLNGAPSQKSLDNATGFSTSKSYTRFFCKGCGCNLFVKSEIDGSWSCCAGIVELKEGQDSHEGARQKVVSKIAYHYYVGDASDGGIAPFLTKVGGRQLPCYTTEPGAEKDEFVAETELQRLQELSIHQPSSAIKDRGEMLDVSCHCGSCKLRIAPPAYNASSEGWYISKQDRSKYYARLCCCRSCRLTLGFALQPWTYIPPSQIMTQNNEAMVFGPSAKDTVQVEKLKYYQSSDTVLRSFCGVCGATMFYQSFDRPYIIDVSVGVLRSKSGNAMAGEWLEWDRDIVSKRNEAVEEELVQAWLTK